MRTQLLPNWQLASFERILEAALDIKLVWRVKVVRQEKLPPPHPAQPNNCRREKEVGSRIRKRTALVNSSYTELFLPRMETEKRRRFLAGKLCKEKACKIQNCLQGKGREEVEVEPFIFVARIEEKKRNDICTCTCTVLARYSSGHHTRAYCVKRRCLRWRGR